MSSQASPPKGIVHATELGRSQFQRQVAAGHLTPLLPGIAAHPDIAGLLTARAAAAIRRDPDAVITGEAAAALTWWPELERPAMLVEATSRTKHAPHSGYRWRRLSIPPEMIAEHPSLRIACPEFTVLQLAATLGGRAIDEGLRRRVVTLASLDEAISQLPSRPGNKTVRQLLRDSRNEPWSEPERLVHRLFREAGICGWQANRGVRLIDGRWAFLDIAFAAIRLCLEIDGAPHHSSAAAHEHDCRRDVALSQRGWLVVRFTAAMVQEAGFTDVVRQILARRCHELGRDPRELMSL